MLELLFADDRAAPSVDAFNLTIALIYQDLLGPGVIKPASHTIPSLILWLARPDDQFFVRPELYNQATRALTGGLPEGQGNIMSSAYTCGLGASP